ncbi:MAG: hypothetical protein COZ06_11830 [Armatimonadetes bacterium CG_4_10_14_3_um_filter_66_18]|nr:MAG: hypothetical protein COS65_15410 [Armatimonadetes bacterium CG06_land_8_20_14_3_00_66_21]PIY49968.1 MAG: hypothetical protein COZ06_11830 [Armatimonadetes bacterium CG_4_10_14_3_um_filter_66_18]PJB65264.1 MAG: hypothetical protein CO096_18735 [Armatimonadetes bacterium CG_4_9_14_3_um_filter_66_14]
MRCATICPTNAGSGKERTTMARYQVKFYKGDYGERQRAANADAAVCYVEQHFNSVGDPSPNYTMVVLSTNASETASNWARRYSGAVAAKFGIKDQGIRKGGRGDGNLARAKMPAILLEPFFVSNPQGSQWAKTRQQELAEILVGTIREFFPDGGAVAFSVGHKYKRSAPNDRGASAHGGGNEADLAEAVLLKAQTLLEAMVAVPDDEGEDEPIHAAEVSPWAREAHEWVVANGISDGTRPQEPVTREQLWTMLHRAATKPK